MFSTGKYYGEKVSLSISYGDTLRDGFRQNAINTWLGDLARPESKLGKGRNKLRSYVCKV
jgi:hypothetical protein